jgi:hypothetical protein
MFDATHRLFLGLALADAHSAAEGHILHLTEREPDLARGNAGGNRLLGRQPPDGGEHEVVGEHAGIGLAELIGHGQPEFAQSHGTSLGEGTGATTRRAPAVGPRLFVDLRS